MKRDAVRLAHRRRSAAADYGRGQLLFGGTMDDTEVFFELFQSTVGGASDQRAAQRRAQRTRSLALARECRAHALTLRKKGW